VGGEGRLIQGRHSEPGVLGLRPRYTGEGREQEKEGEEEKGGLDSVRAYRQSSILLCPAGAYYVFHARSRSL
jgi:hypothetical protein